MVDRSNRSRRSLRLKLYAAPLAVGLAALSLAVGVFGQSLYKYRGPDGEWVFTDRNPGGDREIEVRSLSRGSPDPRVSLFYQIVDTEIQLHGRNEFHAPVEVEVDVEELREVDAPQDADSRFVLPPRQESFLMSFTVRDGASDPYLSYRYRYLFGDPGARHQPPGPYRAPFAIARSHRITQAFPDAITHSTPDSAHAVDFAMPVGTDIHAARGGVVIDVASTNFADSLEPDGAEANVVRILHDDGTFGIYAHLNWNGIRVRPGDVIERGQYIADSGNTGFSTGPHLHFVVVRNAGMQLVSVPVDFEGANGASVTPTSGLELSAY